MSGRGRLARALVGLALVAVVTGCNDDGRGVRDEPDGTPTTSPAYKRY